VLLAAMAALVPLPVAASDGQPAAQQKTTQTTLKQAVRQQAARTPLRASSARSAQQGSQAKQSTSFFRTPVGLAALAVMVVGTGYAIYSTHHDRITSPGAK
jgi:hypothetical protein